MTPLEEYAAEKIEAWVHAKTDILRDERSATNNDRALKVMARRFKDPVVASWIENRFSLERVRRDVDNVRVRYAVHDLVGALRRIDRFEIDLHHVQALLTKPYLRTGWRMREGKLNRGGRKAGAKADRDVAMAREYLKKLGDQGRSAKSSRPSKTALKESVGRDHKLKRSAAVDAVNRGMKKLSG